MSLTEQYEAFCDEIRELIIALRAPLTEEHPHYDDPQYNGQAVTVFPQNDGLTELLIDGYPVIFADEEYVYTSGNDYPGCMSLESFIEQNLQGMCEMLDKHPDT